jgi:hypothetical protein
VLAWTLPRLGGLQLTRWKVERSVHRAVDDARLKTGVRVAERYCGAHDTTGVASSDGVCDQVPGGAQLGSAWRFAQLACRSLGQPTFLVTLAPPPPAALSLQSTKDGSKSGKFTAPDDS